MSTKRSRFFLGVSIAVGLLGFYSVTVANAVEDARMELSVTNDIVVATGAGWNSLSPVRVKFETDDGLAGGDVMTDAQGAFRAGFQPEAGFTGLVTATATTSFDKAKQSIQFDGSTATTSTSADPPPPEAEPSAPATTAAPKQPAIGAAATTKAPVGMPGTWNLKFSDEFNGTTIDSKKWTANWLAEPGAITKPINAEETSCYDPKQAAVANGELRLTAIQKSCVDNKGKAYGYASGMLQSNGKFNFTHGAFEARMWTPVGKGLWPAFWATGQNHPMDGEIDVVESYGDDMSTYHYHFAGCASGECNPGGGKNLPGATAGWHTYAANWQKDEIVWYYDGQEVYRHKTVTNSPLYLVVNLGLKDGPSTTPSVLRVDYVRVWQ